MGITVIGGSTSSSNNFARTSELYPLNTKLTLYPAYPTRFGVDAAESSTYAGNPLGNGHSIISASSTQITFRDNTGSQSSISPSSNIDANAVNFGGAIYLSTGNILVFASDGNTPATLYIREFDYSTKAAAAPVVAVPLTTYGGFGTAPRRQSVIVAADGNYLVTTSTGNIKLNSSTLSIISEEISGFRGEYPLVAANRLSLSSGSTITTTTFIRSDIFVTRPVTTTSSGCFIPVSQSVDMPPYSPFFNTRISTTDANIFGYVGYSDGKVWRPYVGVLIDIAEFDTLMQEFEDTYLT